MQCYNRDDARGFGFWTQPEQWVGWDALLIDAEDDPCLPVVSAAYFQKVELLAEFPMTRSGVPMRPVKVYLCTEQTRPYPFESSVVND